MSSIIAPDVYAQKFMGKLSSFYLKLKYKSPSSAHLYGVAATVKTDDEADKTYIADKDTVQSIRFFFDKIYTVKIQKENYHNINIIVDTHYKEKEGKIKLKKDIHGGAKLYYEMNMIIPMCSLSEPRPLDSIEKVQSKIYFDPAENEFVLDTAYLINSMNSLVDNMCPIMFQKTPEAKIQYVDFNGKLVYGDKKSALVDQGINLKDNRGTVVQTAKTDVYGDFSFKKLDPKNDFSVVLDKNAQLPAGEKVYLSKVTGEIIQEIVPDMNNDRAFDLLSSELLKLTDDETDKNAELLRKFKSGTETQITITENILYAPSEWQVPQKSFLQLISLVKVLQENPAYKLEIFSHTDAVGDARSNMILSDKRAQAMSNLFVNKGISKERITWKGFGETKIINRCVDGIECPDKENQVNRRTEFKIIKG